MTFAMYYQPKRQGDWYSPPFHSPKGLSTRMAVDRVNIQDK